ncbi:hypothetical protein PRUB_a3360 [Pseudoalteromonas rubra]|uniref:Uncharacterized protein n=1 Tax=Pseudoalteromonas rubra TaxID=43658 RepID=A0A8T0C4G5_9GAMM|nr:hypothetical protein PRUB_a3360 [Pseudoalteromonas rubra]
MSKRLLSNVMVNSLNDKPVDVLCGRNVSASVVGQWLKAG